MGKTLKDLIKATEELNEVLGLSPEIPTTGIKEPKLVEKVKEAAELVDLENDEISVVTLQTLRDFDIEIEGMDKILKPAKKEAPAKEEKKGKKAPVKEEVPEEEDDDADEDADDDEDEEEEKPETKKSAKNPATAKEEKPAKKEGEKKAKPSTTVEAIEFLTPLITKKKYTQKELVEKVVEEVGIKASSASTLLTDGRNEKYNRFPKLIKKNEEGILSF